MAMRNMTLFSAACGGKEVRDLIVKKRQSGGPKPLGVGGQIHASPQDSRFELCRTIAAVAKTFQDNRQITQKVHIDAGVSRQGLAEG